MAALGIDIGGTFVKFFAVSAEGKILRYDKIPTDTKLSGTVFLKQISVIINEWKQALGVKEFCIGVGIAGDTDHINGVLRFAPNIPWRNLKVAEGISKNTGCFCCVSNDANMAAWGVSYYELKNKYSSVLVITMGTGIGGGLVIEHKLYQGATGSAGEFGHICIDCAKTAPLCGCGQRGCFEAFCGTKGIKKLAYAEVKKNPKSILAKILKEEDFSVSLISKAAEKGCPSALKLWRNIGGYIGRAMAGVVLMFNPEVLVFAGGVSRGAKYFMPEVKTVLGGQTIKMPFKKLKIMLSKEGNIGGIGAALYALSMAGADEK